MKKWLIILSIIFAISSISCVILAGHIYYNELQIYEDYDKQLLNVNALNHININSDVAVNIYPTDGEPYVEFKQKYVDLAGMTPEYTLEVETKGDSTSIDVVQTKGILLALGVKEVGEYINIYLPKQDIASLNITNNRYDSYNKVELSNININELDINMHHGDITLEGNYDNLKLSVGHGIINVKTDATVTILVEGNAQTNLEGNFKEIDIQDNYDTVNINSLNACNLILQCAQAQIDLKGKYNMVKLEGEYNTLNFNTDGITNLTTAGEGNAISGVGALDQLAFNEYNGQIDLQIKNVPSLVDLKESREFTRLADVGNGKIGALFLCHPHTGCGGEKHHKQN